MHEYVQPQKLKVAPLFNATTKTAAFSHSRRKGHLISGTDQIHDHLRRERPFLPFILLNNIVRRLKGDDDNGVGG